MLEGAGASVATTASARDTRALVDRLNPDVLIADQDARRRQLLADKWLRAQERGSGICRRCADRARPRGGLERALESGFEIHVAKPIDASELPRYRRCCGAA